jgi:hypothetical protein
MAAQESRGAIRGSVTDPTHAVVPGAKVTLHNVAMNTDIVQQADSSGFYAFERITPGIYNVIVEAAGFEKFVQENVSLQTTGDVTVNAILTLGAVTQTVEVTAAVAQVEFNTATMSDTVQSSFLKDLPILARSAFTLALLDAGVINDYWDEAHRLPFYMWSDGGMDIGGPTGGGNEQIIDGNRSDDGNSRGSYNPPMDAVQEVVVQQNIPDAEHGFSSGGAVNISMKSGTNDIHGDAYGMWRQPSFNALANRVSRSQDIVKQNIYGFTIGNPIIRNKLFNFFAFEDWRATQPSNYTATVPTPAELTGDFSAAMTNPEPGVNGGLSVQRTIYDPNTTVFDPVHDTVTRTPISCNGKPNVICANAINPTAAVLMPYLNWGANHTALTPDGSDNFEVTFPWWTHYHNLSERVDFNASDKLRIYAHYSEFRTRLDNNNPTSTDSIAFPSQNGGIMDADSAGIDLLYMMNPRTTIDIKVGVNYTDDDYNSTIAKMNMSVACPGGSTVNTYCNVYNALWPNDNWWQGINNTTQGIYFPNFNFTGIGGGMGTGVSTWWYDHVRNYNPQVIVTHEFGKHHMKFGWQYRYYYTQNFESQGPGYMYFNSQDTASSYLGYDLSQSGDQFASAEVGAVDSGTAYIWPTVDQIHQHFYGAFVQDDFRLNSRTTLNLGVRWEHETGPQDNNHYLIKTLDLSEEIPGLANYNGTGVGFNVWTPAVLKAANLPTTASNIPTLVSPSWTGAAIRTSASDPTVFPGVNVFLPRAGIAYKLNDKTALRVGYSRFEKPFITNVADEDDVTENGFSEQTSLLGPLNGTPRAFVDHPYPSSGTYANPLIQAVGNALGPYTDLGNSWGFYPTGQQIGPGTKYTTPMNDKFNFNIQRQLPAQFRLDVTEYIMLEHNAQDGSMWGGWGSCAHPSCYSPPFQHNLNQMNPAYSYKYEGLLATTVPNPFYNAFPATPQANYTGTYMPGPLGTESTIPLSQLLQPYPQYGSLTQYQWPGNVDHYYGLAISVTRPMTHGWTFLGTYNYSLQSHTDYYNDINYYANNLQMFDRGLPRHNIRLSGTYQLPFGKGRSYLSNAPRWLDEIVGGWATSDIFYFMSGDLMGFPTTGMLCNPSQNIPKGYWFNPSCLSIAPPYTESTAPPYYEGLRGPRYFQLDSTAVKYFKIGERFNLEFRLEMYNSLNHYIPADPNIGYSYGAVDGKSTAEASGSNGANYGRELQGSLRLHW